MHTSWQREDYFLNISFLSGGKYMEGLLSPWETVQWNYPLDWQVREFWSHCCEGKVIYHSRGQARVVHRLSIVIGLWLVLPQLYLKSHFYLFTLFQPHWPPLSFFHEQVIAFSRDIPVLCPQSGLPCPQLFIRLIGPFTYQVSVYITLLS